MSTILSKLRTTLTFAAKGKQAQHEVHRVLFVACNGLPHAQWLSSTCTRYLTDFWSEIQVQNWVYCPGSHQAEIKVSAGLHPFLEVRSIFKPSCRGTLTL